jgi:oxygen-dependent protoporphyrinogen oxidase
MSELVDALVRRLQSAAEIHLDARVDSLARLGGVRKGYSLSFAASAEAPAETATFDAVILALPAERAAEVLQPVDPSLAAALAEIEYASSAIVCTSHSAADIAYPLDASGLVVPATEKRRILSVSFASRKFARTSPEDRVVLRSFVGGALQPEVLANSDDELVQIVLSELHEILGVRGKPRFAVVSRHMRAMPQYKVGHLDRVRAIENLLAAQERLALGGNAYSGVGIPDCIKSGELAAERVFGSLKSRQAGGLGILPQDAGRR